MSWELMVKEQFSSAHFLEHYKGKCEKMHGHTFRIEAYFRVTELNKSGIGIDFVELKAHLNDLLPDHKVLNDVFDFSPSAENLSRYFYLKLKEKYPVTRVVIWESDSAAAIYAED